MISASDRTTILAKMLHDMSPEWEATEARREALHEALHFVSDSNRAVIAEMLEANDTIWVKTVSRIRALYAATTGSRSHVSDTARKLLPQFLAGVAISGVEHKPWVKDVARFLESLIPPDSNPVEDE